MTVKTVLLALLLLGIAHVPTRAGPFEDGIAAYQRQDFATALRLWRPLAQQGHAYAANNLAVMFQNGDGVGKDFREAARWYRIAAERGLADAQFTLGTYYDAGWGVSRNSAEALVWFRRAADQGHKRAQFFLGGRYRIGLGLPQDFVQAHKWWNLAGEIEFRDEVASYMTSSQVAEAHRLAREWRPKYTNPFDYFDQPDPYAAFDREKLPADTMRLMATGSGFFVTREGHILTNAHVVKACKAVQTRRADGDVADARVVATSIGDDLALLKVERRPATAATFRGGAPVRQGEGITVYGFPLSWLLASTGNLTVGHVTALSGPRNDPRLLQISAAVQPGNSGGPVLDNKGNVIGVVVSKLDALAVAGATGDIPQNINFAIKASVVTNFLEAQGVAYVVASGTVELATTAIVDRARASTVRVDCLR